MLQLLGRCLLSLLVIVMWVTTPADGEQISIVVDRPLPSAARRALDELRLAITNHGDRSREVAALDEKTLSRLIVGVAGNSPQVDAALKASEVTLGEQPESFALSYSVTGKMDRLIAGRDERGVTYALREAARAVELTPRESPVFSGLIPANETPFLRVRNVSVHLFNADCERDWYFDDAFWHYYFKQLSFSRFNHFTLTFSDQTNYLCPLYAYLVEMPEYPNVKVEEVSTLERAKNLAMLRQISDLAAEYGIDFNLGIWMQAPVERWSAPVRVTGLPQGLEHAQYCALGLRRILDACPAIRGLQLRMNAEAGVNEEQQTDFYRPMFRAIREVGRPIRLDLRYKGLQPSTTQAAIDEKLDVTVSTKYWAEHFGLPYHPTSVDSHWREDRYSFGAMLKKPRPYRVVYQLWNVGSQRISLWGDPDYARRFVESCTLGGGEGFEVFAPLTNQGYGDKPGKWDVIANPAYRVGRWPQERYWFFYLCFGRLGYNPKTNPEVCRREFRERFGESAQDIESAYRAASQVLPLITAARLPGASEWSWWPEMDTGGDLREYARIQPSDPRQFYAIRTWQKTEKWRWEEWDESPGYVEDLLAGKVRGKWTPWEIARQLDYRSTTIDKMLVKSSIAHNPHATTTAEVALTRVEARWLGHLASYHAEKLRAATYWALYEATGYHDALWKAHRYLIRAVDAWRQIVDITNEVYHDDLVFGISTESPRSKFGHHHAGHWRDRLAELEADLKRLVLEVENPQVPMTRKVPTIYVDEPSSNNNREFNQLQSIVAGEPCAVQWALRGRRAVVHYRPLDQTREWRELEMTNDGDGKWSATIPGDQIDPQFDFQYYFELLTGQDGTLSPDWPKQTPYFVVPVTSR
ncbi:MAG: hypothetical protein JNM18_13970 [Planctomycetaceae bacterium]|nr:hypothetical protein [Planctomycetaceae bacterium]